MNYTLPQTGEKIASKGLVTQGEVDRYEQGYNEAYKGNAPVEKLDPIYMSGWRSGTLESLRQQYK